jgi:3-hydroxybutyryl-CoA dehydrogenase
MDYTSLEHELHEFLRVYRKKVIAVCVIGDNSCNSCMRVAVLANENLKEELLSHSTLQIENIIWVDTFENLQHCEADAFIDLVFERKHLTSLQSLLPKFIIINSVEETLAETDSSFVRINGWPTFLQSRIIEASSLDNSNRSKAEEAFSLFNKKLEWLPDEIGFVTPRVICMIINEAFIALKEGVSTKEEIDTAMKLGTNYPYGPFEWAEKIGVEKIKGLLEKLSRLERYTSFVQ